MLSITDISVRIAGRLLIDHGTAQIVPGARVGLIGRNGAGKSTLFHAMDASNELAKKHLSVGLSRNMSF